VPGATYGSDTPLEKIGKLELSEGEGEYFVGVDTSQYFIDLGCDTRQKRDQFAAILSAASGAPVWNGDERVH